MLDFSIKPVSKEKRESIQQKIDTKTKPLGALGQLEKLALQIACIQNTETPRLQNPHIAVFAADHGIAQEGVSAYPSEVTAQMVLNFVRGGAAINAFCRQHNIALSVIDAGVNFDFQSHTSVISQKTAFGTKNIAHSPAMTLAECQWHLQKGAEWVQQLCQDTQCNIIGLGEMGIGNTSASALLMHHFTKIDLHDCIGKGTGLNETQLIHKQKVLTRAYHLHQPTLESANWLTALATLGGYEIVQMCGAMLQAAQNQLLILIDGFIASVALLVACQVSIHVKDYAVFCHQSAERGHEALLQYLKAEPLLRLNLRLGEGTGCALAYPLLESAVIFLNEMATFEQAGVSNITNEVMLG
ncbi:MAG: nicotinate-nucleotide--dimethylbenzimidazole phosphoribosyltransferase [Microscillaceae bacterium]|nr:nicotinate-nucleotide--dimethylbenzimidazole phosphoribosyltransferase [Microscillaceae bacterium]MDW8461319.1 nicotinate-nucleotide--dimethylbenzimidazole phosphoribosyltransferase [Cytophagales bacterium]